ncbi:hypothetical protein BD289DRAFT_477192 [Coniella lustricola]|uniref:Uncharacterized protein n=1 Tax=Coniella lustricola TaxID=2025994 RepID=A0A2T2ZVI4_9PEZI|nr:hypothetical protein BD289DRAFT_477192 [Coniella lustricola]
MKPNAGFTWLFFSLSVWRWAVYASHLAGPYEAIYMWIAFQVDVYGAQQAADIGDLWTRSIATSFDSSTTFDQFIKGTLMSGIPWAGTGLSAATTKYDTIDVQSVAQTLRNSNYPAAKTDYAKLFPTAPTLTDVNGVPRPAQYHEIMNLLTNTMENGYKLGLRAVGAFNNARDAMEGIQAARMLENQVGIDTMVDMMLKNVGELSSYKMVRSNDAATGAIDWEKTLNSGTGDALEKATLLGPLMVDDRDTLMEMASSANSATRRRVTMAFTHSQTLGNVQQWLDKLYQFSQDSVCL